jgi:hypothetical protein
MDLIINENDFNEDNISIKYYKNTQKILYNIGNINIIGLPFKLNNIDILKQTNKYIILNIKKINEYDMLKSIDIFFIKKFGIYYCPFIMNDTIKIKKNQMYDYNEKDIYITITNIKKKNSFITIQLFTI